MFVKVIQCLKGLLLHFNVALMLCQGCGSKLLTLPLFPSGLSDSFKEALPHHPSFVDVRGTPGRGYYVQVLIGTPPQQMSVLIDTGSSNFAIASSPQRHLHKIFNTSRSSSFRPEHQKISVSYAQGSWTGSLGREVVLVGGSNTSLHTQVAFITSSRKFFLPGAAWQGIWGLGYEQLTTSVDGVTGQECLWSRLVQKAAFPDVFTLVLHASSPHMTLGGVDEKDVDGRLHRVGLRKEWYYEVVVADVTVAGVKLDVDCKEYNFNKAIVDSGTSNLHFPPTAFQHITQQLAKTPGLPGAMFWQGRQTHCVSDVSHFFNTLPNITISLFSHPSFPSSHKTVQLQLSPPVYVREISRRKYYFYKAFFGVIEDPSEDKVCFRSAITTSRAGVILGAVLMEPFVVVFDRAHKSLLFARYKGAGDLPVDVLEGSSNNTPQQCSYKRVETSTTLVTIVYTSSFAVSFCVVAVASVLVLKDMRQ